MQFLLALFLSGVAAFSTLDIKRSDPVLVRTVIDGDTIDVATFGRVRLLGIDAPEIGRGYDSPAPFATEARDRLTRLVLHRWIRLEQEGPALDVYNRHLAYVVTEDGVCANVALVREGLARISARLPLTRLDELKRAEAEAQAFRRGMWGQVPGLATTPSAGYTRKPPATKTKAVKVPKAKATKTPKTAQARPAKKSKGD